MESDRIFSCSGTMVMLELKYKSRVTKVMLNCFSLHLEQCRIAKMEWFGYFGKLEQPQCQRMVENIRQYSELGRNKLTDLFEIRLWLCSISCSIDGAQTGQGLRRSAQVGGMVGQLTLNLPRPPQLSKLLKNGPGFRAGICVLNKVGRGRNATSWPACPWAVRKRKKYIALKGPNVAPDF